MAGKKGRSGGARRYAGRPRNSVRNAQDRKALALAASEYTMEALETMVKLMRGAKQESVKLQAADRILDRAIGKAPMQIDITALRHDQIVYRSAEEIRAELVRRGVPPLLIDHLPNAEIESPPTQSE
jgi:hypothetical protein